MREEISTRRDARHDDSVPYVEPITFRTLRNNSVAGQFEGNARNDQNFIDRDPDVNWNVPFV